MGVPAGAFPMGEITVHKFTKFAASSDWIVNKGVTAAVAPREAAKLLRSKAIVVTPVGWRLFKASLVFGCG